MALGDRPTKRPEARPAITLPGPPPSAVDRPGTGAQPYRATVFALEDLAVYYGDFRAVRDVTMNIYKNEITAFIGPSGCGKTTVLRGFNRMHDVIPGARVAGKL